MVELIEANSSTASSYIPAIASIYQEAFAVPPYNESLGEALAFEGRLPYHIKRKGFKAVIARLTGEQRVIGFAYGYAGKSGTWWFDIVRQALEPTLACRWMANCFEFCELAVLPAYQGQGWGGALHDRLLEGLSYQAVLLSTPKVKTNALQLYRKRGWVVLLENFEFPGVASPYQVMGKWLNAG